MFTQSRPERRILECFHVITEGAFPLQCYKLLSASQVARKAMHEAAATGTPPLRHKFSDRLITFYVVGGFARG